MKRLTAYPCTALRSVMVLAVAATAALCAAAEAENYPAKPVRLVVPFPPGGGADATGRVVALKLTAAWRQQVVVDNRTGAGTTIGNEIVAHSVPDGYTLLVTNNALTISAGLYPQLRYSAAKDFLPIMEMLRSPFVLVVPAVSVAKTTTELIALAKAKPGELALANTGIGSGPHLAGVLFGVMAGASFNHIPYKGFVSAMQDLMANRVQLFFTAPIAACRTCRPDAFARWA